MRNNYPELTSEHEIKHELDEMGIDIFEPETRSEEIIAQLFDDFSHFVLHQEKAKCIEILENDLCRGGGSVGELQGGSDDYSIYRVSFPTEECDGEFDKGKTNNAALDLLNYYNEQNGRSKQSSLTMEKIKSYMLGMCDRRSRERNCGHYTTLGNLMFIMQFGGPTIGQVRHIDNMVPNLQLCVYMSSRCPSTIVYAMDDRDGLPVTDVTTLIEYWERGKNLVPELLKDILVRNGDRKLKSKWHTKYFAWDTINSQLLCFGKLYQPVAYQLGLQTEPGTTLLAGGNEIHAGPPTKESRMFAFAIGIPEEDINDQNENNDSLDGDGENDGEVQYSPVLFHLDFCSLLFSMLDYEFKNSDSDDSVKGAKHFLVDVLIELIRDYPMNEYLLQIPEDRVGVRTWLESILTRLSEGRAVDELAEEAVYSDKILYSPDVIKRSSKKKKGRSRSNKTMK